MSVMWPRDGLPRLTILHEAKVHRWNDDAHVYLRVGNVLTLSVSLSEGERVVGGEVIVPR